MSVGGFAENTLNQLYEIGSGIVRAWPTAIKSGAYIVKNADALKDADVMDSIYDTMKHVASGIAGPESDYAKHGVGVLYERPLTPVLDAMTVLSLGGGMIARTGKLAGGLSRAGLAADVVSDLNKLRPMTMADKVATLGEQIAGLPNKLGRTLSDAPLRAIGINPESRRALKMLQREEQAIGNEAKFAAQQKFDAMFKGFSKVEKEALDKMAMEGTDAAERAAYPRAAGALDEWKMFLREREGILGPEGRALLTKEAMNDVIARKYARRVYGQVGKKEVEVAKAVIESLPEEFRPVYTPAIQKGEHSILDLFKSERRAGTGTGFLKPYKGTAERISDPTVYMRKAADQFYDMETKLRFLDRTLKPENKLVRAAKAGEKTLAEWLPEEAGFYRRYAADKIRQQGQTVGGVRAEAVETAKQAGTGAAGAERSYMAALSSPGIQKYMKGLEGISAQNNTVGRYLKYTFTRPDQLGPFLRVYDKVMNLFKMSATVLSPRWYMGNIVGDAVLSTMAGEYGLNWRLMKQALGSMPPELRLGRQTVNVEIGLMQRKLGSIANLAQAADDLAKRGIWTKEVARRFKVSAASFAAGEETLKDFVRSVGQAHLELSNMEVRLVQLDEQIARSLRSTRKIDREIAPLEREAQDMATEIRNLTKAGAPPSQINALRQERWAKVQRVMALDDVKNQLIAEQRVKMQLSGEIEKYLPEVKKYADVSRAAVERANAFMGDYLGLGPIERGVFRRVIPFYAWTKAMAKLTFMLPFIAPKTAFFWHRWSQTMMTMAGDRSLPEWAAPYAPVGTTKDGKLIWVNVTSLSPFEKYPIARFAEEKIPALFAFWRQNPFITTGYRMMGGRDEFYWAGKPQPGMAWVSAGDGTVNRFRPDGKIENVVPQAPVLKTLANFFPSTQFIEQWIAPYKVNKGGAMNPDGTYRFPDELWDKVARTLGASRVERTREDMINAEKRQVMHILRDLQKQYPRADESTREYIRGVFEDVYQGKFRKMKAR